MFCLATASALFAQERDDATARVRAREQMHGAPSVEAQLHTLQEAAKEAAKWGVAAARPLRGAALVQAAGAVPAGTWVNVGPAGGVQLSPLVQSAADSSRMRKIVPHPDGGIFRSSDVFTAQPDVNQTGAPHFEGRIGRGW